MALRRGKVACLLGCFEDRTRDAFHDEEGGAVGAAAASDHARNGYCRRIKGLQDTGLAM